MNPEEFVDRLIVAAEKKYSLLKGVLFISQAQTRHINEDSIEGLQKLIGEKQSKIDEINKIDEAFDVYFRRLKQMLGVTRLDEIKASEISGIGKLQDAVGSIMTTINEISEIEKLNNKKAGEVLGSLANKVKLVNQGKQLNNAYMPGPVKAPSYFFDKKK
jgi:methyl-accepting chemotaxis protein